MAYLEYANPYRGHGPLRLRAIIPGGRAVEQYMHALCDDYRLHGEWFSPLVLPIVIRNIDDIMSR